MPSGTVKLKGTEFDVLVNDNYKGPVTWDVTTPDGGEPPVKWFELQPKQVVIGLHATGTDTDKFVGPDGPAVAVFGKLGPDRTPLQGKAVVVAYGVVDGKAKKLASKLIECNLGAQPPPVDPIKPVDPVKPVVIPEGRFGLAKFAYDQVPLTVPAASRSQAKALAGAYRKVAADASITTPAGVLQAAKVEANKAVDKAVWDAFGTALQEYLWGFYERKLLNTTGDFKAALTEVATGLELVEVK